jgi:hypothetical protein
VSHLCALLDAHHLWVSASAALARTISAHSRTHRARDQRTLLTLCSFAPVLAGPELVYFYKYGLFEASENDFIDDLIGVLVESLIGTFGNAACKSAEFFINIQMAYFIFWRWPTLLRTPHTAQPSCAPAACVDARMRTRAFHADALADAR